MSVLDRDPAVHAAENGLECVVPGPDELLLDIDDAEGEARLARAIELFAKNGEEVMEVKRTVSAGGNAHVYLSLPRWSPIDQTMRVALQACFGSDPMRELLSIWRIVRGYDIPPTVLFERPETPSVVETDDIPY